MRTPLIAGNWKMYKTPEEARSFVEAFLPLLPPDLTPEVVLCPPAIDLSVVLLAASGSLVRVGAQNMHFAEEGAYTGEISAPMLTAIGVTHVILGHSERRQYFAETDSTVNQKLKTALKHRLVPIVCVGENLAQREGDETEDVLRRQTREALAGISAEQAGPMVIAYEPVWAIGTGRTATPQIAAHAHLIIRSEVASLLGRSTAETMRILYGGSVKPDNARELCGQPEIDGALVGGASLEPQSFAKIVAAA
jgi:triosephosphate isomerase (TIM)